MLAVDGRVAFVTGLCVGREWVGIRRRSSSPGATPGSRSAGPPSPTIERAFAQVWAMLGEPFPEEEVARRARSLRPEATSPADGRRLPATAGMFRLDQLVAALARQQAVADRRLLRGDAPYVQALRAAARDGVDVRLLVPERHATSRSCSPCPGPGYRPLLEAGVRIFEWNGTMLHAKTAVADGRWARVGSTNLNLASWLGNCELDVAVEDEALRARRWRTMYLEDLEQRDGDRARREAESAGPRRPPHPRPLATSGSGSASRAAAGAVRIGNAIGAAFTNRRVLEPVEARILFIGGSLLLALAVLFAVLPRLLAYPVVAVFAWIAGALLYRGYRLNRERKKVRGVSR